MFGDYDDLDIFDSDQELADALDDEQIEEELLEDFQREAHTEKQNKESGE